MINKYLSKIGITSKLTRKKLVQFIERNKSEGLTLDIGCAYSPYKSFFPNRIGVDINFSPGVDIIADAHKLPFENEKFENILCSEVLEHLHSPWVAIAEMGRVLKKGGHLILTTRFIYPIHDAPNDFYRFTRYGLKNLFSKEWNIIGIEEEFDTKNTLAVLLQRIGYQSVFRGGPVGLFIKFLVFLSAKFLVFLPSLLKEEYGDIKRSVREENILSSGYYMVCEKR